MDAEQYYDERWRPVVWYAGLYEVSDFGNVRSVPHPSLGRMITGKVLRPAMMTNGYLGVSLSKSKGRLTCRVHVLVAEAWIGLCPRGRQMNHKDLDKTNNHLTNLEWVTPQQNSVHALDNGVQPLGEAKHNVAIPDRIAVEIAQKKHWARGEMTSIARKYGVGVSAVSKIARGTSRVRQVARAIQDMANG